MKNKNRWIFCSLIALLLVSTQAFSGPGGRGGGGGGRGVGGGGRGVGRGDVGGARGFNNNIARTPSMSRANNWGTSGANYVGSVGGANVVASGRLLNDPGPQNYSNVASRGQLQQFLGQGNPGVQGGLDRGALSNQIQNRNVAGNNLRQDLAGQYPNRGNWFNNQFWGDHNYNPAYNAVGQNWWGYSTWNSLNGWLGWDGGVLPVYYDDGNYYDSSQMLGTGDEQPMGAPVSSAPVSNMSVQSMPVVPSTGSDWLPLGVFALTSNESNAAQAVMFFQLTVNKVGTISGAYYNQATDQVYPIEGIIDKSTQKAIWKISQGNNSPIFETEAYNLTLSTTSVGVNFNNNVQNWMMVRM